MVARASYHHGDLRSALLAAVRGIIRDKGVGALSLREAARRAGVSHSAPAHHFGDKLGMLTAFAIQGFEEFRRRMQEVLESTDDATEAFNGIGLVYLDFAVSEPEWFDVMFRSELHDKDDPAFHQAAVTAFGVLTHAVETLCEVSGVEALDAEKIAIDAWAKVHGLATLWRDGALQMFVDQPLEELAREIMEAPSLPGR